MINPTSFMLYGKPLEYWIELHSKAQMLNYESLIEDNVKLKMRIAYLEQELQKLLVHIDCEDD